MPCTTQTVYRVRHSRNRQCLNQANETLARPVGISQIQPKRAGSDRIFTVSSTSRPEPRAFAISSSTCSFGMGATRRDRKSTRLNSSHGYISYAVFCLKKKKKKKNKITYNNAD